MKENKKDLIILTVGAALLIFVCLGVMISMLAPFDGSVGSGLPDGVYEVELMMLGATENLKTYELKPGDTLTVNVKADSGYILPEGIDVDGAEYTWNKSSCSEGVLVLSKATKDVEIKIEAFDSVSFYYDWNSSEIMDLYGWAIDVNSKDEFIQNGTISLNGGEVEFDLGSTFVITSIDCDEGLSATWRVADNGVTVVTYTYDGTIPADGTVNAFVHIEKVNSVSLSAINCFIESSEVS